MHRNSRKPAIGIGGIVFDQQDRILLIQRATAPARGQWSLPGGRQEAGETMQQACCREFFEETGLEVAAGPIVAVVERMLEGFHYVIIDFLVVLQTPPPAIPRPADDVADARWLTWREIPGYGLVEGLFPILAVARALRNGGTSGCLSDISGAGSDFVASGSGVRAGRPR